MGIFYNLEEHMKYPNLRYGNPTELQYYAMGIPLRSLCYRLRRRERIVRAWLSGEKKIPFWVPELLRLQQMEHEHILWQMNIAPVCAKLGIANQTAQILPLSEITWPPQCSVPRRPE